MVFQVENLYFYEVLHSVKDFDDTYFELVVELNLSKRQSQIQKIPAHFGWIYVKSKEFRSNDHPQKLISTTSK